MGYRMLGRTGREVEENCRAADLPRIPGATMRRMREIYERRILPSVHQRW